METQTFIDRVQQRVDAPLDEQQASAAVAAVLQALGQVLPADEAHDLGAQLPDNLAAAVTRQPGADAPTDGEAFRGRVAALADLDEEQASAYADATLSVLRQAVSSGELVDVALQLPWYVSTLLTR